jgi:amino acid adenylation domain-containing protein/non-ribosomal peptide synthase protein (TIGR01720 family)
MSRVIEDIYPLSPMQHGMLFHALYEPGSDFYIDQIVNELHVGADFDPAIFVRACQALVDRHPALRTAFAWEGERAHQIVVREARLDFAEHDWRGLGEAEREARLAAFLEEDRRAGFDLARPHLIRVALIRLAEVEYRLVLTYHHLLLDAWSVAKLLRELGVFHEAFSAGREPSLPPARPYRDYIAWLRRRPTTGEEAYWKSALAGFADATPLVVGRPSDTSGPACGELHLRLSPAESAALYEFARAQRTTVYMIVEGAWALLLARFSGEQDVVFALTLAGRPVEVPGAESIVGLFINTLPVRVAVPPNARVGQWLATLRAQLTELRRHEHTSLARILAWSDVAPGAPLFHSILSFENIPGADAEAPPGGLDLREGRYLFRTNYPLNVMVVPGREIRLRVNHDRTRLEDGAVARLLGYFRALLLELVADPQRRLCDLEMLTDAERRRQIVEWNATARDFPAGRGVHALVEEQARRVPNAVAVEIGGEQVSYSTLNRRANQLARQLRALGVGPGALVGIYTRRSVEMVVGILGVLKAGGAYVPLDPAYPEERLAHMIDDAGLEVILAQSALAASLPPHHARVVPLERHAATSAEDDADPASGTGPDDAAYVIYTSGSTGKPKGVVLLHGGLCNLIPDWNRLFGVGPRSRVLQFASFSFDASVWETFSALVAGATLCFGSRDTLFSGPELMRMLRGQRITHALLPPSLLGVLEPEDLSDLEAVAAIGEKCTAPIVERWGRGRLLCNAYGPAEATITVSAYLAPRDRSDPRDPPIGRPMANTEIYILDPHLQPVPVGVPGELVIGGRNVARGYLNHPELTALKFVPDPFSGRPGARLYRSGDLARFRPDGDIEFLGRIDHQVKIRGVRVELGEIEVVLRQHPAVAEAIVVVREIGGPAPERRLVAYVVPRAGAEPSWRALRAHLAAQLPEVMVPSVCVVLAAIPVSPNGKVNRSALPEPAWGTPAGAAGAPARDDRERKLVEIWSQVLRVDRVGVHDNFFALGGDSILSIQIISRAARAGLRITPRQLFENQTVAELAQVIDEHLDPSADDEAPTAAPLTPIQRWFFSQGRRHPHHFNQAVLLSTREPIDAAALARAAAALAAAHDALRLRFARGPDGWCAEVSPGAALPVDAVDLGGEPPDRQDAALQEHAAAVQASLDLERGPLARIVAYRLGSGRPDRLLVVAHHLAVDGVSWRFLLDQLDTSYARAREGADAALSRPPVSWARWADHAARAARSADDLALGAATSAAPLDQPDTEEAVGPGATIVWTATPATTETLLRDAPQRHRATVEELLLAALAQALVTWTDSGALRIIVEHHGREPLGELDPSQTVGWFTTLVPVTLDLGRAPSEAVIAAKEARRRASPTHADGVPPADVCFNYLGQLDALLSPNAGFTMCEGPVGPTASPDDVRPYPLEINAFVLGGALRLRFTHAERREQRERVEHVVRGFEAALTALLADGGVAAYVPLDFPHVTLDQERLDLAIDEID